MGSSQHDDRPGKPNCFLLLFSQNWGRDRKRGYHRGPPRLKQENLDIFCQRRTARAHRLREHGGPLLPGSEPEQERAGQHRAVSADAASARSASGPPVGGQVHPREREADHVRSRPRQAGKEDGKGSTLTTDMLPSQPKPLHSTWTQSSLQQVGNWNSIRGLLMIVPLSPGFIFSGNETPGPAVTKTSASRSSMSARAGVGRDY